MKSITLFLEQTQTQTTRSRVGVFLIKDNKLILGDAPNYKYKYFFPGGGLDPGEDYIKAAIRECKEEIAIVPKNIKLIKHPKNPYKYCGLKKHGFKYDCSELIWVTAEVGRIDKSIWGADDGFKVNPIGLTPNETISWLDWCIKETKNLFTQNTKYKLDLVMVKEIINNGSIKL